MIYLASPYSDPDPKIMESRALAAMRATVWLLAHELWAFSPIAHCHEMAKKFDLPKDYSFWQHYNKAMLRRSTSLYLLNISGLEASTGVQQELNFSQVLHLPVYKLNPTPDSCEITPYLTPHKRSESAHLR